jgi:hypothetical protein
MNDSGHPNSTPGMGKFNMTYERFCAQYKPSRYDRVTTPAAIQRDTDTLQRILACALYRLDQHRQAA